MGVAGERGEGMMRREPSGEILMRLDLHFDLGAISDTLSPEQLTALMTGVAKVMAASGQRAALAARSGEERLPRTEDLTGSDPDYTGELSTAEYLAQIRE